MVVIAALFLAISAYGNNGAVTLPECGSDGTVEMIENKTNNTVTCIGIPDKFKVEWKVSTNAVSSCPAGNSSCYSRSDLGYTATKPTATTSAMTIDPTKNVFWVRGVTLTCLATQDVVGVTENSCKLDIVSPPQNVSCNIKSVASGSSFSVVGWCEVTKVYSFLNRTSCQWYIRQALSAETVVGQPVTIVKTADNGATPTGGTYIDGRCEVTMAWPTVDGTYMYRVVVTPGGGSHDALGPLDIKKPSPRHSCPLNVIEGQDLTCTCAGEAGLPPAELIWETRVETRLRMLTMSDVRRSKNGTQYRCLAVLSGAIVLQDVYTLNVVYGPDGARITAMDLFDTDGLRDMTANCSYLESNPSPNFSWTRPDSSEGPRPGQSYTFRPQPPKDDGAVLQCRAQNTVSNKTTTTTVTINLNYPPITDPVITNSSGDGNLYQGDTVTFTCTVTGGKPVNATSVTLTCPSTQNAVGTADATGVTSSVTLNSLSDGDHAKLCTCSTTWKGTSWYTKKIQTSLFVNTPPSPPSITAVRQDVPFIAGGKEAAVLTCVSQPPGRPAARYDWPVKQGGQNGTDGQGQSTLTFRTLSRADHGKVVTCKSNNLYTDHKQQNVEGTFTLQVYYPPDIAFSAQENNDCSGFTQSSCEVTEGRRVHIRCSAESNPEPAGFKWTSDGGSDTESAAGSDILDIAAANHTIHNRKYNCTVTTGPLNNSQQLLTSSEALIILVKYKPVATKLTLNAQREILTIDETETVVLACQAGGRPTPSMALISDSLDPQYSQGEVTELEDRDTWYNTTLTAQCHHTGQYRCTANNSVGEGPTDTAKLFVNCKPRGKYTYPQETPIINYVNTPQQVSFNLVAYPLPDNFTFFYLGPSPDNRSQTAGPVTSNTLQMTCFTTNLLHSVTCNVTVFNITSEMKGGLYAVNVSNAFGHVQLEFMITFNESVPTQPNTGRFIGGAIGGGIAAAVIVIIVAAVIVLFIRRQRKGSEDAVRGRTKEKKPKKIKLSTLDHSGASSTHDEAMETDEKTDKKPTAVVSPKRKSKSRTHHGKAGTVYENVELNTPAGHHNDDHPSRTFTEHSTRANQPMSFSANHLNLSSTTDHQTTNNASEDDHAHPSANTHSASPATKKHPPSQSAHRTNDVREKHHSSTKHRQNPPSSHSTHTGVTPPDVDACREMEPDDAKASESALYNDVEYMTSQGATLGLDRMQQYLLDKLRGSQLNEQFEALQSHVMQVFVFATFYQRLRADSRELQREPILLREPLLRSKGISLLGYVMDQ